MNRISIEEEIHNIKHNQKVIIKSLEQIKSHLWRQPDQYVPEMPIKEDNQGILEAEAVSYVHNVLIPDLAQKEAEKGDMVAQSAWIEWAAKPIIEYLKGQALIYIGKALEELKNQLIPLAIDIADWVLDQLENLLLNQYEKADSNQKNIFKEKIQEKFPNSRLLTKLT
ncbi:MAG: hypothetical protein I3273_04260 [Candidatus Moeniiplasma glomeromycotorum]|nr:hypothetical protein [Candidatus Moeniiplasma glomeromycotorum]